MTCLSMIAMSRRTFCTNALRLTSLRRICGLLHFFLFLSRCLRLQVQEELVRRRVVKTSANGKKRSYSCNHCFSQIVRLHWNNRGVKSIVWRCISRLESTELECHAITINELVLQYAVINAINQMLGDKSSYQAQLQLRELRQQTTVDIAARDEQIKRINDLQDYIAQQTTHLTEFDESLVRRWIKQIIIWDDHISVKLKSDVSIGVDS